MDEIGKQELIKNLTDELTVLRATMSISQKELSDLLDTSRQTYSAIETKKRAMTWSMFLRKTKKQIRF